MKLKPCFFCGVTETNTTYGSKGHYVQGLKCNLSGPTMSSVELAQKAWNICSRPWKKGDNDGA